MGTGLRRVAGYLKSNALGAPAGTHTYTVEVKHSQFAVDGDAGTTHLWALLIGG